MAIRLFDRSPKYWGKLVTSLLAVVAVVIVTGSSVSFFFKNSSLISDDNVKIAFGHDGSMIKERSVSALKPFLYDDLTIDAYTPGDYNPDETYHYFSPYEERFPNYKLTYGFRKTIPYNDDLPTDKQICFVHVGKAGGSTIGCSLGFSLHCSSQGQVVPNSLLPILTTHTFHRGVYDCQDDAAYFLFVVRDPLSRLLSAFNYDRPQPGEKLRNNKMFHTKEFYLDCPFWTLDEMAQNGLLDSRGTTSSICRQRAWDAIRGTEQYIPHWFFNYQYYYEFLPENAKVLVIRNEHIVDDYNGIEHMLGGDDEVLNPSLLPENNVHNKNAADMYLSDDSKMILCHALCNEIQFYKKILKEAVNFMEEDVMISLEELRLSCPDEVMSDVCDEAKPDITDKIRERKIC